MKIRNATPESAQDTQRVLIHIMTSEMSLRFLEGQPRFMTAHGYDVSAVTSPGGELIEFGRHEGIVTRGILMHRSVTPFRDLIALALLVRYLKVRRPLIVHAHTPKAGLLGMIASKLLGVPIRIYHIHGLPFMSKRGVMRWLLQFTEWLSCLLATHVLAVSHSMRDAAIGYRLCIPDSISVIAGGTSNGINAATRYYPRGAAERIAQLTLLGIPSDAIVLGFVGRLVRDKGIQELVAAWRMLRNDFANLHLLLVGPLEAQDPLDKFTMETICSDPRIHSVGYVNDPTDIYAAVDVLALPTYREGFPNVPLEAAAMQIPVVATNVPGCTDAILDGQTGTLVPCKDPASLAAALRRYISDPELRVRHGERARERILSDFQREAVWNALLAKYEELAVTRT